MCFFSFFLEAGGGGGCQLWIPPSVNLYRFSIEMFSQPEGWTGCCHENDNIDQKGGSHIPRHYRLITGGQSHHDNLGTPHRRHCQVSMSPSLCTNTDLQLIKLCVSELSRDLATSHARSCVIMISVKLSCSFPSQVEHSFNSTNCGLLWLSH